ncbi:MAG: acyl carrier protein [Ruminococcaceae bacterium]|nr:acyl carrier protein [Oscillospiraceae bacterium]
MDLEVLFKITQILEEIFDVQSSDITPETDLFEDLGADEFDMVEISMILEEEFDITPDEDEFEKVSTVADLCKYVENS